MQTLEQRIASLESMLTSLSAQIARPQEVAVLSARVSALETILATAARHTAEAEKAAGGYILTTRDGTSTLAVKDGQVSFSSQRYTVED